MLRMVQLWMDNRPIKASERKCCKCEKKAVAWWPCIDPDIQSNPYCRDCLDTVKIKTLLAIYELEKDPKG